MRIRRRLMQALLALSINPIFVVQLNAHGGDPDLIHACINKEGVVRIVGPDDDCDKSETARHWIRVRPGNRPTHERKLIGTKLTS
ncbi:MAG TPA: hypothetical protein VF353_04575 [Candidatus Binatia bacterium]